LVLGSSPSTSQRLPYPSPPTTEVVHPQSPRGTSTPLVEGDSIKSPSPSSSSSSLNQLIVVVKSLKVSVLGEEVLVRVSHLIALRGFTHQNS
jgi:hypothetical protein